MSLLLNSKQLTPNVSFSGSFTGSLFGTASYALFAANGGGGGAGFPFSGSAVITGSLLVSQSGLEVIGNQIMSGAIIFDGGSQITPTFYGYNNGGVDVVAGPGGFAELASNNSQSYVWVDDNGAFVVTANQYQFEFRNDGYFVIPQVQSLTKQAGILSAGDIIIQADEAQSWRFISGSGVLQAPGGIEAPSFTGSLQGTATNAQTASYVLNAISASYTSTASYATIATNAQTASYAPSYLPLTGGTISSDLTINQNLYVLGTASIQTIQYVSQSSLNIGTNLITVNTSTPSVRFGGLAVYDSGSTGLTGSILWDSLHNTWIYTNPSGGLYDGAMILVGPRSVGLGNEVGINSWYAALGNGSHHMTSSQIYNSGSLIRLETDTQVTGTLNVSIGITSSLFGTSSWATNALTASYIAGGGAGFPYSGSAVITGSLVISGSGLTVTGSTAILGALTVNGVSVAVVKARKQDFVYPFSYCGTAPFGSADASAVWTIVRINMSGSVDTIGTATNVAWTNRYTATYT